MATPILYTTVEAIRACVGLDEADLPDEVINSQTLKTQFTVDLDGWYPANYVDDWAASDYDPTDESDSEITATTAVERRGHLLSLYSMWFGAYRAIETLMVIPHNTSDGKNEIKRFSNLNLEKMLDRVRSNLEAQKGKILEELSSTSVTSLSPVSSSSGVYDPITGV